MKSIGFIGMGNMGCAMLRGMLKVFEPEEIIFSRKDKQKGRELCEETGVTFAENNRECATEAKYLILAVKPQMMREVLEEIGPVLREEQILISIAAGKSIQDIRDMLGRKPRIVRAMPNTPALLGEGMTGLCFDDSAYSDGENTVIHRMMESFGRLQIVKEELMDAVICVSGSSPAYVYLFIEALADGAVKYGLPRQAAYEMAAQTVLGAARMVLETGEHPGVLKDRVCSPGGTTIAGVAALEEGGFRSAVIKACDRCYEKAENMGDQKKQEGK